MDFNSLVIAVGIIIIIFLIIKFFMKTLKIMVFLIIAVLVIGGWFYGFSGFFDKISDIKEDIPELKIQKIARSITGCTADEHCVYVSNSSDCVLVEGYCNNIFKEENYQKLLEDEILEEECNKTNIEFDPLIECRCILHKEREGKIKQWLGEKIEKKAGYTYCWKKD